MKLVASVIMRNEKGRYLEPFLNHLLQFVDEIRVLDDGSTDGTAAECENAGAMVKLTEPSFYAHEGQARNRLLEWTMRGNPTHILAIDADEFVADGLRLRQELIDGEDRTVWNMCIEEVWQADQAGYRVRCDGGWRPHGITFAYKVPEVIDPRFWKMQDHKLACGRVPLHVHRRQAGRRVRLVDTSVLHVGWACKADRRARYERYVEHDGGRFHNRAHLDSIMLPDDRLQSEQRQWPEGLMWVRDPIAKRAQSL